MPDMLIDMMPALAHLNPLTVAGLGVMAVASLMFLVTRMPEFLLVALTAMAYSVTPLL